MSMTASFASKHPQPDLQAGLDLQALQGWLQHHMTNIDHRLQAERIDGGQSNPSWRLRGAHKSWVLRAKPGPAACLLPSAHAIEREYRILSALQHSEVPVPPVHVFCEDESVIGAAFYVMDHVEGRIFRDASLPEVPKAERAACFADAARVLAALHRVDWRAQGLLDFGRHEGYFTRQIRRWSQQALAAGELPPAMHRLMTWLPSHIPAGADAATHTCITHGDYRIENLMFHPSRSEVVAVLDWELSTLGHPLSDLSYSALAWHMPAGILRGHSDLDLQALGLPSEQTHIQSYCASSGMDPADVARDWPFHLAFNLFRLSAILLGIGQRKRDGQAANASAGEIAAMAAPVAEWGWAIAQPSSAEI